MSDNSNFSQTRNEAVRVFASEYSEAVNGYDASDDEKAAQYNLLPTGVGANRVLMMGTLTEVSRTKSGRLCATVQDGTGIVKGYAGQYSPKARSQLVDLEPEGDRTELSVDEYEHVMLIGKTNNYESNSGTWYTTIDLEYVIVSDKGTRNRWEAETAEQTLDRIVTFENGEAPYGDEAAAAYDFDMDALREDVEFIVEDMLPETGPKTAPSAV